MPRRLESGESRQQEPAGQIPRRTEEKHPGDHGDDPSSA
jgi:hypothetical protein